MRKAWKSDTTLSLSIVLLFISALMLLVDSGSTMLSVYAVLIGIMGVPFAYLTERFAEKGE